MIKKFVLTASVSALLLTAACNSKTAGPETVSEAWIKQNVSTGSPGTVVTGPEAEKALSFLELLEPGDDVTWDARTGEDGDYTFENIKFEDGNVVIETLSVSGLRMLDEQTPMVDGLTIDNLTATDEDDGAIVSIDFMEMALPNAEQISDLFSKIEDASSTGTFADIQALFASGEANLFVGGGLLQGLSLESPEFNLNLEFAGWAEDEDSRKASVLLKNLKGQSAGEAEPVSFSLASMSFKGLDLERYDNLIGNNLSALNPFNPEVESLVVSDFDLSVDTFSVDMPSVQAWYTDKKEGKFHSITDMPSLSIGFSGEPEDPDLMEMKQAFDKLGYETIAFSLNSKTLMDEKQDLADVEVFNFSMKDGFNVSTDYKVSGLKKIADTIGQSAAELSNAETTEQPITDTMAMVQNALSALKIHQASLEFTDSSILERAFNMAAAEQEVSADLIRQQAKSGVMMAVLGAKTDYQAELAQSFAQGLQKLIEESGSFKISLSPEDDLNLGQIMQDYQAHEKQTMDAFMESLETEGEMAKPEPFDWDTVLKQSGLQFEHKPKAK